jgi:hypothetical protein
MMQLVPHCTALSKKPNYGYVLLWLLPSEVWLSLTQLNMLLLSC